MDLPGFLALFSGTAITPADRRSITFGIPRALDDVSRRPHPFRGNDHFSVRGDLSHRRSGPSISRDTASRAVNAPLVTAWYARYITLFIYIEVSVYLYNIIPIIICRIGSRLALVQVAGTYLYYVHIYILQLFLICFKGVQHPLRRFVSYCVLLLYGLSL